MGILKELSSQASNRMWTAEREQIDLSKEITPKTTPPPPPLQVMFLESLPSRNAL